MRCCAAASVIFMPSLRASDAIRYPSPETRSFARRSSASVCGRSLASEPLTNFLRRNPLLAMGGTSPETLPKGKLRYRVNEFGHCCSYLIQILSVADRCAGRYIGGVRS
jgi:hypothetical protein